MKNIEIKAKYPNITVGKELAAARNANYLGCDLQIDTYFKTHEEKVGRFKLRESSISGAYLVPYIRSNQEQPKASLYTIIPVPKAEETKYLLSQILGVDIVVKKRRDIYLIDNIRVHLDDVEGLGYFFELEAVCSETSNIEDEENKVKNLLLYFRVNTEDLLAASYLEMLKDKLSSVNLLTTMSSSETKPENDNHRVDLDINELVSKYALLALNNTSTIIRNDDSFDSIDIGCGDGENTIWLNRNGFQCLGIDKALNISDDKAKIGNFSKSCIMDFQFPIKKYKLVLAINMLQFLSNDQKEIILDRMISSLVAGGILIIESFTIKDAGYESCVRQGYKEIQKNCFFDDKNKNYRSFFTTNELCEWGKSRSLNIIHYEEKIVEDDHAPLGRHSHGLIQLVAQVSGNLNKEMQTREYLNRAFEKEEQEKFSEALDLFDQALKIDPNNVNALMCKGGSLLENFQKAQDALKIFNKVIELNPPFILDAYVFKGIALKKLENEAESKFALEMAISFNPKEDDARGFYHKARALCLLNKNIEAIEMLKKAFSLNQKHYQKEDALKEEIFNCLDM
ncbi:MAG: methyltransferase domain-containing protein [Oligoflexia bacterium]|nr:methyltransferase domain-containing protein [Oligoflexia bacterium]